MKERRFITSYFALLIFVSLVTTLFCSALLWFFQPMLTPGFPWASSGSSEWSVDLIEQNLSLDIPSDAHEIQFEGRVGGGTYMWAWADFLDLSFSTSPESANAFLKSICDGILLQGFDPFRSESVSPRDVSPDTIIIKMDMDTHYARMIDEIPETVYGNRCWGDSRQIHVHEIMVDKSDSNQYRIRFMRFESTYEPRNDGPVVGGSPALTILEDSFVPVHVLGAVQCGDKYVVIAQELCIEMYPEQAYPYGSAVTGFDPNPVLFGADVSISIDGQAAPSASINELQSLMPDVQKEPHVETTRWNYCLDNHWSQGLHQMHIKIITVDKLTFSYSWEFEVE